MLWREDSEGAFLVDLHGECSRNTRHTRLPGAAAGEHPLCAPQSPDGPGAPGRDCKASRAAEPCRGGPGRLSTEAAAGEKAQESFADFPPAAACYREAAVPGSSKKTNVFSGDFDKINHNHLDKAHFISDKNPRVNLFYVLLNEM